MADVNSNININFNTAAALAQLRSLQAGLSKFHQTLAVGNLAAANAQKGLNAQLLQSVGATGKFSASQVKVAGSTLAFTSALEKNKLSLREYYRYTMAAATANTRVLGKAFAQEREIINRARRDRVKALQSQYIQMNKANSGFIDAIRIMPKSLQMASGKFTELGTRIQYAAQRQQFLNQLLKQGSTQLLNFGKNTQWAGRQLMVGLTMPLALFGAAAAKSFKDLEAEIVKFRRVYGNAFTNDAEVEEAIAGIRRLGTEYTKYGVSVTKTMEMAALAAAAGFTGSDLTAQVETATKLSVLGNVEQQQALETTISLQSAFGISSDELAKKIDFLNAVENQTLLSIEDLTIAIPKAAPVVKQLGGTVEDLAFFLTAMKEGGINASEGANALKSGLASLINPSDKAAKFLGNLGINIKGIVEGNAGDIKGTVVGFAQALDTLDPLNRARAIEQMFGKFQFSRLSTLFQNVTKEGTQASRALDLASSSMEELAVMSEREMKKIEDATGVKFQAAIENFKQEIMPLGKAFLEALTPVVKFFGGLFEKFNSLSDKTKKVIATIIAVVAGLGPIVLMTFGLLANGIANVIKFFAMLRGGIAKLNGQTSVMGAGFNYMTQEQIENAASSQSLHQTHTRLIEVFNVEKASVSALASSYNFLSTQMRSMAAQNPSLFAGGMSGAKAAVSKLPPVRKYEEGIISVPGPAGAGDVVPAMLSPGEAVIPTETTDKYRGLITAMFQDKVPGFMAGRLPGGPGKGIPLSAGPAAFRDAQQAKYRRINDARQGYSGSHSEKQAGSTFVGMPTGFEKASQSRQILDKISNQVKTGRFANVPPTDFGTKLEGFTGYSFPARGVGGVFRKPNGKIVVVKPTMTEATADAEVRMTQIEAARGMVVPRQTIKTMLDPTDPTGQRKFIVLESPYDPRIASMSGKFSKSDMVKQLVGSAIRGDKDLQKANVSGNVVADVGNAGVMDRASGFREFAKTMPSMEEQAMINLLGVKGGAKKFFAQETSSIAAKMTPKEYGAAIKSEINRSIPPIEKIIKSWNLQPDEQIVYNNMLKRLKDGAKVDWAKFQPIHARAGGGIEKLEVGNFEKFKNMPESRDQIARLSAGLSEDAVKTLKRLPQDQQEKVLAAMRRQKPAATDAMSQSKMIKFVEENMIYKDGLFHDKKSLDAGRDNAGKTYDQVMKKVFYQMGLVEKDGVFVSDKKINMASRLRDAMSPEGKASGGWRGSVPKNSTLFKVLDAEEQNFRAQNMMVGKNDPLKVVREKLSSLGYSEKEIARALRSELSHVEKTGESGRGPAKYLKGSAMFDLRILNNYMNTKARSQNIMDWNNKSGNPLKLSPRQLLEFQKAAEYMKPGSHPTTLKEIQLVQKAAQLDILADDYLKNQAVKPKGFPELGKVNTSRGVLALLDDRIGTGYYNSSRPVFNLASGPDQSQKVLVDPKNEFKVDTKTGRVTKLTTANTGAKPAGAVADSGSSRDTRTTTESPTQRVATRSQVRSFRRGFTAMPGFSMPGRVKGDPELSKAAQGRVTNAMQQQAKLLKQRNNLTQKEINQALTQYRTRLIAGETEKRNNQEKQKAMADEKRQRAQSSQTAQQVARQTKAEAKREVKEKRMARQQKIGGISGGLSMGLGTAGMGLMMAGQQTAGMAVMGASAVAGLAPMFAGMGPTGLIATGVVAVGASLFLLNKHLENSAKKQVQFVESVSATTSKMEKIGVITNKVGASRSMDEVRKRGVFGKYNDVERAGTGFGDTFLSSEVGKSMVSGFVKNMETSGSKAAAQDFALELSAYVSDGVLNEAQASDIANQIGIKLGSRKYPLEIMGNLRSIIGINGEDLTKDPLKVRMQIVNESNKRSSNIVNRLSDAENSGNSGRTESAQLAALAVNNLSIAKAQADATEFQYIKQIQLLEKELESTTNAEKMLKIKQQIAVLEGKMVADVTVANKAYSDQLGKEVKRFNDTIRQNGMGGAFLSQVDDQKEDAYFDALKGKIKDVYKDTDFATAATKSLEKLAKLSDKTLNPLDGGKTKGGFDNKEKAQEFEVRMSMLLADRVMNPEQLDNFMAIFNGDLPKLQANLDLGLKRHGPAATVEMLDYFTSIDENGDTVDIATKIIQSNKKDFKEIGEALAQLSVLDGKEINLSLILKEVDEKGNSLAFEKLLALSKDLAVIEKMPDKMSKELILKYFTTGAGAGVKGLSKENLETLFAQWKDFSKLPAKAQKEAISKFTTLYATVFADQASREAYAEKEGDKAARESGFRGRTAGAIKKKRIDAVLKDTVGSIAKSVETYIGQTGEKVTSPVTPYVADTKGGKNPLDFIDELAMRLKQVKDNAFNALTPIESLIDALTNKQDVKDAFNLFDGIQNRLLKLGGQGLSQGLRDAVSSMSAEEFAKVAELKGNKALFTFETDKPRSKDTITGLAQGGKAVDKGYYQRDLGNFNLQNEEIVKNINDQNTAYKILISNGLTASQALEAVADQGTAAALAAGEIKNSDPGWKTFIDNIKTSNTALERQAALNKIRKANEDFKFQEDSIGFAKSFFEAGLSMQQIQDILSDPQMAALLVEDLKDGKIEAEGMKEYLDNIPKRIEIDIKAKLAQGDFLGAAGPGFDIIDKMFEIQKSLIEHAGKAKTKPIIEEIEALEVVIEAIKTEIKLRTSLTDVVNEQGIAAKALGNTNSLSYEQLVEAVNVIQKALEDEQRELEISPVFGSRGIDALNEEINDINRTLEMDPVFGTRAIDKINEEIDSINRELEVDPKIGTRFVDELNEKIDDADRDLELNPVFGTRAIETLQEESSVLSNDLEVMNYAAEKINEEYDKQAEALQKVSEINQDIVEQQKQQIDLAGALSSGDIAAAAQAAQQMRQSSASRYSEGISSALEQSRTNSVDGLRSPGGKSKKEIEERQYQIAQKIYAMETNPERVKITQNIKTLQDQIYSIEEEREKKVLAIQILEDKIYNTEAARKLLTDAIKLKQDEIYTKEEAREKKLLEIQKIEDAMYEIKKEIAKDEGLLDKQNKKLVELNKQLDIAQKSIQNQLDNITIMGKDKDGWDLAKTKLEAYNTAVTDSATAMKGVLDATAAVESDWASINDWLTQWLGSDGDKINLETIHTITTVYATSGVPPVITPTVPPGAPPLTCKAPLISGPNGQCVKPKKPQGDYDWDDSKGWIKSGSTNGDNNDFGNSDMDAIRAAQEAKAAAKAKAEAEAKAKAEADAKAKADADARAASGKRANWWDSQYGAIGGLINPMKFAMGGFARGTDTVPAMLTPGEFIMSKYAVEAHGINTMKAINNGQSTGGAVYNNTYALTVNANTDASPNEIAQAVMSTIRQVDDRRIRGVSLNAR